MNNTFNLKRFMLLFKKHSIEHFKTYLLSIAVLLGLLFICLGFGSYTSHGHLNMNNQSTVFAGFMLIGGSIFTSLAFLEMGDKKKAIPALTLPASHFEKYLVSWLYTFVLFQAIFLGAFYLVDAIIIYLGAPPVEERDKIINVFTDRTKVDTVFYVFALLHGFSLWGAIFFEKLHFIKTSVVFFACLLLLVLFNSQLLKLLVGKDSQGSVPFQGVSLVSNNHFWMIQPHPGLTQYGWSVLYIVVLLLWTSAYFRLKEKEV